MPDHLDQESEESEEPSSTSTLQAKPTPFPRLQLFLVILIQFAEPVTSSVIYPFIAKLVWDTGVTGGDEKQIGYFAGIVESIFYLAEFLTVLQWGRAADRVGRKPVLLIGMLGLTVATVGFGVSKNFWAIVVSRMAQGVFNGNIGVTKTVMAEITDPSNIADAFSYLPFMWSSGSTLGPIIGGIFADPANRWPDTMGRFTFLHTYPFFLPCFIAGMVPLVSYILTFIGLKETLHSALKQENIKTLKRISTADNAPSIEPDSTTSLIDHSSALDYGTETSTPPSSSPATKSSSDMSRIPLRELLSPRLIIVLFNHAIFAFVDLCFQVLLPLMYAASIPIGGLGLSPFTIGMTMGIWGILNATFQVLALSRLMKAFGPRNLYNMAFASNFLCVGAYPLLSFFAKRAGRVDWRVITFVVIQFIFRTFGMIGWACTSMFVIDAAPSKSALGATNALAQMASTIMRSLAPSVASSLFAISLERNLLGGNMVYMVLMLISLSGFRASFMLPKHLWAGGA